MQIKQFIQFKNSVNFKGKLRLRTLQHISYLEKLQFDLDTLRLWSNGIQDEIMEESQKAHLQMMRMIRELQRMNNVQPWVAGWQVAPSQAPPSQAPAQLMSQNGCTNEAE